MDDLIHLRGPLTEDAVVRALQARFYHNKFYVCPYFILLLSILIYMGLILGRNNNYCAIDIESNEDTL